jgi:hypothetical protein
VNAGYREDYRQRVVESAVIGPDPITGQVFASRDRISERIRRNVPSVDFSGEYDPNDRQSLSVSASWMRRGGLRTYTQLDDGALESGAVTSSSRRFSSGHDPENDYNTMLRLTQKLSEPGESLDIFPAPLELSSARALRLRQRFLCTAGAHVLQRPQLHRGSRRY